MKRLFNTVTANYINRYDPTYQQLKLATRTLIAVLAAYFLLLISHRSEQVWLGIPTLLFSFCHAGPTLRYRQSLLLACIATVGIGVLLASIAGNHIIIYLPFCFFLAGLAFYITQYGMPITMAAIMCLVMIAIAGSRPTEWPQAVTRLENILLSGALVFTLSNIIFPYRLSHTIEAQLNLVIRQLERYCNSLFTGAICGYQNSPHINTHKDRCFDTLKEARPLIFEDKKSHVIERWRVLYRIFNCLRSMQRLLAESDNTQNFNTISRYLSTINHIVTQCLNQLNQADHQPSLNHLDKVRGLLCQEASHENEDIASMAFLVQYLQGALKEYHALIHPA